MISGLDWWWFLMIYSPIIHRILLYSDYSWFRKPCMLAYTVQRLGELFRKLWNPRNFKAHVSPHEMLQAVASTSKKRFKITEQGWCPGWCLYLCFIHTDLMSGDPIDFLSWLLNSLHMALGGTRKNSSSMMQTDVVITIIICCLLICSCCLWHFSWGDEDIH